MQKIAYVFICFSENLHLSDGESVLHSLVLQPTAEGENVFRRAGYFRYALEEVNEYLAFLDCACSIQDEGTASVFAGLQLFRLWTANTWEDSALGMGNTEFLMQSRQFCPSKESKVVSISSDQWI